MDNPSMVRGPYDDECMETDFVTAAPMSHLDKSSSKDSGINSESSSRRSPTLKPISKSSGDAHCSEALPSLHSQPLPPIPSTGEKLPLPESPEVEAPPPCGLCGLHPRCLLRAAHPISYLVLICSLVFVQSFVVSGYTNSITTTIEKRYNLRTLDIGITVSMYDAACIITTVFVSYYANQLSRARYLAVSGLVMTVGFVIFTVPHYTGSVYRPETLHRSYLCSNSSNSSQWQSLLCKNKSSEPWALYIFLLAQIVIGVGATPIYIIGPTFLFDMLRPLQYPIYSAFIYVFGALGPACGFALSSIFLTTYIDFPSAPPAGLNADHSQWLGAWWVGFVLCAALVPFVAAPLLTFKKSFPAWMQERYAEEDAKEEENRKKENGQELQVKTVASGDNGTPTFTYGSLKNFPTALKRLFCNPIWLFISLLSVEEQFVVTAFAAFGSKYLQTSYGLPAYQASIRTGAVLIPSACVGLLVGAVLVRKMRLNIFHASSMLVIVSAVSTGLMVVLMFLGCDSFKMAGLNYNVNGTFIPNYTNFTTVCNQKCGCSLEMYRPVCEISSRLTYYSPCHAGCTDVSAGTSTVKSNYTNCHCTAGNSWLDDGRCLQDCSLLIPALIVIFVMILVVSTGHEPMHIITLSGVAAEDRSFALGMQVLMNRLFAFVPAPILFGYIFDSVCILRTKTCFNSDGFCSEYDLKRLPFVWIGLLIALKAVGLIFALSLTHFAHKSNRVTVDLEDKDGIPNVRKMKILSATLADVTMGDASGSGKHFAVRRVSSIRPQVT